MCGIVGVVRRDGAVDRAFLCRMRDTLAHRGPDGEGAEILAGGRVGLGHRRLSILDLSPAGRQPMTNEDGSVWLVFNGEIYNFAELRRELECRGHRFRSETDSEVIVHGYEEWGDRCVERLRGMFAFGIWDGRRSRLFLARDRFGIKPLYYWPGPDRFVFASELKAIVEDEGVPRRLDPGAVLEYLTYRFVPAPGTIWEGIRKLPPAHTVALEASGEWSTARYWELDPIGRQEGGNARIDEVRGLLDDAVRSHEVSDVPVGLTLSGGLDSTTLATLMTREGRQPRTFSIGFVAAGERSEHLDARMVAETLGTEHHEQLLAEGELNLDLARKLSWFYDEPISDTSTLPTYAVAGLAAREVKVVLGGDGGDEVFGGYNWYDSYARKLRRRTPLHTLADRLRGRVEPLAIRHYATVMSPFSPASRAMSVLGREFAEGVEARDHALYHRHFDPDAGPIKSLQILDLNTFLPEICLTKVDRATMAHSLEARVPFLDHPLVEAVFSLPEEAYRRNGRSKTPLRDTVRGRVPDRILRKNKQGFGAPALAHVDPDTVRELLLDGRGVGDGIFAAEEIERRLGRGLRHLWPLVTFELWMQTWLR